jgi:hypothetical protein
MLDSTAAAKVGACITNTTPSKWENADTSRRIAARKTTLNITAVERLNTLDNALKHALCTFYAWCAKLQPALEPALAQSQAWGAERQEAVHEALAAILQGLAAGLKTTTDTLRDHQTTLLDREAAILEALEYRQEAIHNQFDE